MHHGHHTQQIADPENLHVSNHHHQWNPLCLLEGGEGDLQISDLVSIRVDGAQVSEGHEKDFLESIPWGKISVGRGLRKQGQLPALLLPPSVASNLELPV